jgi:predicted nucleic acid-binding protein
VSSFLRGVERARLASHDRVDESLTLFLALPLDVHDVRSLAPRAWSLRRNFTSYDAAYVALAEALEAPLLTLDGGLARATVRHTNVRVIGMG